MERRLCGVREEEIAKDPDRYRDFERGKKGTRIREGDALRRIREIGMEKVRSALAVCFQERTGREPHAKEATLEHLTKWLFQKRRGARNPMPKNVEGYVLGPLPTALEKKVVAEEQSAMLPIEEKPLQELFDRIAMVRERKIQEEDSEAESARKAIEIRSKECEAHSVQDLLMLMEEGHGGLPSFYEKTPQRDLADEERRICPLTMRRIIDGKHIAEYPSLPELRHMAESNGFTITAELKNDWSEHFARNLKRAKMHPMERSLRTMFAEDVSSLRELCQNNTFISQKKVWKIFWSLKQGRSLSWNQVRPILIELGLKPSGSRWALIEAMHAAHEEGLQGQALIDSALRVWRKKRGTRCWEENEETLPGVLPEERGKRVSRKTNAERRKRK
ncbi:MAG: hypothetical protein Greene041662_114 [Candidatus Peregrinibacteria bacterium Greene0416_62]|nr:MAG: hypothetical protein Greene041662_114 [Candidatus Peregrinibacteria bacterium Greene0416_62]